MRVAGLAAKQKFMADAESRVQGQCDWINTAKAEPEKSVGYRARFTVFIPSKLDLVSMNVVSVVPSMTTKILSAIPVLFPSAIIACRTEIMV